MCPTPTSLWLTTIGPFFIPKSLSIKFSCSSLNLLSCAYPWTLSGPSQILSHLHLEFETGSSFWLFLVGWTYLWVGFTSCERFLLHPFSFPFVGVLSPWTSPSPLSLPNSFILPFHQMAPLVSQHFLPNCEPSLISLSFCGSSLWSILSLLGQEAFLFLFFWGPYLFALYLP